MSVLLITGATGFIGRALLERLVCLEKFNIRVAVRSDVDNFPCSVKVLSVGDLSLNGNWNLQLSDVDCIIHSAGRAHILNESSFSPIDEFRRINVDATLSLARQAATSGVKRFIFISSIGVNGNQGRYPFTEKNTPNPHELYAVSKLEAEEGLRQLAAESDMELVIIRPPLVYGPNAPGNFRNLLRIVEKRVPFPLGLVRNQRSMVALENLVDFIITCIDHPAAAGELFLIADGRDLSTPELISLLSEGMGKKMKLLPVPVKFLKLGARMMGRKSMFQRLCGSLQVDTSKARSVLGWKPVIDTEEALRNTGRSFVENQSRWMNQL